MLADHHALVDLNAGGEEEYSPVLQSVQRVSCRGAGTVGNQGPRGPLRNLSRIRHVTVKERIHHDGAAVFRQHLAAQANEAAAGNTELQTDASVTVIVHFEHLA